MTDKGRTLSTEELKQILESINSLKRELSATKEELEASRRKSQYEVEGLVDRNQKLQSVYDNLQVKFDKAHRAALNHQFREKELEAEVLKVEEQSEFYKGETKKQFALQAQIDEMAEQLNELSRFKAETLKTNQTLVIRELEGQNANLKKQNELLTKNISKLEEDNTKLKKLAEEREKRAEGVNSKLFALENQLKDAKAIKASLDSELNSSNEKLSTLTFELETIKKLRSKEISAWKAEIASLRSEKLASEKEAGDLKEELTRLIDSLRKTPTSTEAPKASKEDKIILETLYGKNKELENQMKSFEKENKRLKLHAEVLEEKVALKETSLIQLTSYLYSDPAMKEKNGNFELTQNDQRRIENAKFKKSAEEMRDLIERLVIENIMLKKEKEKEKEQKSE